MIKPEQRYWFSENIKNSEKFDGALCNSFHYAIALEQSTQLGKNTDG